MEHDRVLVVDDDPIILRLVSMNLQARGFEVTTANDGESALKSAGERLPDLVILDIMMPGLDGFEVCRQIRTQSSIPVIMLSAKAGVKDKEAATEVGADDYVIKPFGIEDLLARVRAALRQKLASDVNYDS